MLLGIDIGTTYIKVGLFGLDGTTLGLASRSNKAHQTKEGILSYDTGEMWGTLQTAIVDILNQHPNGGGRVAAVGIASMAESGMLIDRRNGAERTPLYAWYDRSAVQQANQIGRRSDLKSGFLQTGIRPTYKCSLARLLWLKEQTPGLLEGAVWLSAADYIAYRLSGSLATDYTLAGRTYAFDIAERAWRSLMLDGLGLDVGLMPQAFRSGTPIGQISAHSHHGVSALSGSPVAISGHDHICAAFAANAVAGGVGMELIFDSMGTAESLVGALRERSLSVRDYEGGLSYGLHSAPGYMYWVGGLSASGGSLEWLRKLLGDPALSYEELDTLLPADPDGPGKVLYFPYLAGSGSPHTNTSVRAAFIGLGNESGRSDLYQAVLEGTAYEMEYIRQKSMRMTGTRPSGILAAGGGTRNKRWMQIKADVYGIPIDVMPQPEAACLGAALLAGLGAGVYGDIDRVYAAVANESGAHYTPDEGRHKRYQECFQDYLTFQEPLRQVRER